MKVTAISWTSCLVCLRRFAFPSRSLWHPLLCRDHAHLTFYNARLGPAVEEVCDAAS